jgi:hypothetical protein
MWPDFLITKTKERKHKLKKNQRPSSPTKLSKTPHRIVKSGTVLKE